jgi:rhamnulokinase
MARRFIGFDLGAESGRCVVATLEAGTLTLDEVHRFPTHSVRDHERLHWDILAINAEIVEGLTRARKAFGPAFDGIGVDTWGVDYVLLDPEGRVLGYPYHYRDARTDTMMEEAFRIVPREALYRTTGIQFAQYNTVFQLLAETRQPLNMLGVADTMLLMPSYLNYFLSGVKRSEFTIASTSSLADPVTRGWNRELIQRFGFPLGIFPPMVEPGTSLGPLRPALARQTGLDSGVPVIATAGHDTASAVVSVPAACEDWAFLSSGTWSLMGIELTAPLMDDEAMRCNFTNEGGVGGTTRFLKNIIGLWPIQECRRYWLERGEEFSYPRLTELAKEVGFVHAWVDLHDPRFLKPGDMPEKILSYLRETGQRANSRTGYVIRVVLESLAFTYRRTMEELQRVSGRRIEKLHAVGGGIQNELLTQFTADATGIPVAAGPTEGTIVGNIGVQALAAGAVRDLAAWRDVVRHSFNVITYTPRDILYFREHERDFLACLRIAVS